VPFGILVAPFVTYFSVFVFCAKKNAGAPELEMKTTEMKKGQKLHHFHFH
jgi:hypothetical protein